MNIYLSKNEHIYIHRWEMHTYLNTYVCTYVSTGKESAFDKAKLQDNNKPHTHTHPKGQEKILE